MITALTVIHVHDHSPRWRGKCDDCGCVRLRTQVTLRNDRGELIIEWLCRTCLEATPAWPSP